MEMNKEQLKKFKLESFQNIFLVDEQKTQMTISTSGFTLCHVFLKGEGGSSIKKRWVQTILLVEDFPGFRSFYMPFQNIVSTSCEKTEQVSKSMQIFEMFKTSADVFEILPEPLKTCDYADSKLTLFQYIV